MQRINIYRSFDMSWCNQQGTPEVAIGEFRLLGQGGPVDTFKLKQVLDDLQMCLFKSEQDLQKEVLKVLNQRDLEMHFIRKRSARAFEYESLSHQVFRSHCPISHQPYLGEIFFSGSQPNASQLQKFLTEIESQSYRVEELTDLLWSQLKKVSQDKDDLILSLHMARRGGISFQGLRTTKSQAQCDLAKLSWMSPAE